MARSTASTDTTPDDPGSTGDPAHPDTGTKDKVAAGNPQASADTARSTKRSKSEDKAQHEKEIRRATELGIANADKMKRADLQAELSRPEHFSSLLDRDTTHFQNLHYGTENMLIVGGGSGSLRQAAALSALQALGANVNAGSSWAENEDGVRGFQRAHKLEETGIVDRATWDAITAELFPS